MDQSTDPPVEPPIEPRRIPIAGVAAIIAAITANFAIYRLTRATDVVPDELPDSVSMFGMGSIIFVTILTLVIATIAMWAFTAFHPCRSATSPRSLLSSSSRRCHHCSAWISRRTSWSR